MPKKPKLGQNFLVDDAARHRIASSLGDLSGRTVLEIGPGHGAISDILATRAQRLIAIELDPHLAAELRFRFRDQPHVEIHEADILRTDLSQFGDQFDVVGNLPYYITSDILFHLFAHAVHIARAVLMMQREVADRVTARPGISDYSLLSATTALYADAENLFTLHLRPSSRLPMSTPPSFASTWLLGSRPSASLRKRSFPSSVRPSPRSAKPSPTIFAPPATPPSNSPTGRPRSPPRPAPKPPPSSTWHSLFKALPTP